MRVFGGGRGVRGGAARYSRRVVRQGDLTVPRERSTLALPLDLKAA
jgi:hypothetical protein